MGECPDQEQEGDDHSSMSSEYAFNGQQSSADPTPVASASTIPFNSGRESAAPTMSPSSLPSVSAVPVPTYWHSQTNTHQTSDTMFHSLFDLFTFGSCCPYCRFAS